MARDESRIRQILEEMMESGLTPEETCAGAPELLEAVRERWAQMRAVDAEMDQLFPTPFIAPGRRRLAETLRIGRNLPQVAGYEVERLIGAGGMGVVYKARHLKLNRPVAIKMLLLGQFAMEGELACLLREAEAVANLCHPNIVQVYDVGELDGLPYFTMEYVEGGNLTERLAGAPQPAREAAAMVATLADAMQAAHERGVVHRDLKPGNILRAADGTLKVADFSLARRIEDGVPITLTSARVGTPSYMAPEQAAGSAQSFCPSVDIYSLGALLYEMLTGRPPFRAESPAETQRQVLAEEPAPPSRLNVKVPRDLETICLKCLRKDPARRYASAVALAEDLRRFGRGAPIEARRTGPIERAGKWVKRRPAMAALIGVSVLLGLAVAGGGGWLAWKQAALMQAVRGDLDEVVRRERMGEWQDARIALEQARARLGEGGPASLRRAILMVEHDLDLVDELAAIHLDRITVVSGHVNVLTNRVRANGQYEAAFGRAGLGEVGGDAPRAGEQVRRAPFGAALIAALDDWAVCATSAQELARQEWLMAVARSADPDPSGWRDRVRDPAAWNDAVSLAAIADAANPNEQPPHLLVALGERLHDLGQDAAGFLRRSHRAHPADFWLSFTLGDILRKRGDSDEAVRYYQAAIAARPNVAIAQYSLGLALTDAGKLDEAIDHYQRAIDIGGQDADVHYNLGLALRTRGRLEEAIDRFERALRIDAGFSHAHYNLGLAFREAGEVERAVVKFRASLAIEPADARAHYNLGLALADLGQLDEARTAFEEAITIDPSLADAIFNLGLVHQRAGRSDEAIDRFRRVLNLDGGSGAAQYNLALALKSSGRVREAIAHFEEALRLGPESAAIHYNLGLTLRDAEEGEACLKHFEHARRLAPNDAFIHHNLGLALEDAGRRDEAVAHYRSAIDLDGSFAGPHEALGLALFMHGDFRAAHTSLAQFLVLAEPDDSRRTATSLLIRKCQRVCDLEPGLWKAGFDAESSLTPEQRLDLAEAARASGDYAAAARLADSAFAAEPALAQTSMSTADTTRRERHRSRASG